MNKNGELCSGMTCRERTNVQTLQCSVHKGPHTHYATNLPLDADGEMIKKKEKEF
jgi:hypothetical protein